MQTKLGKIALLLIAAVMLVSIAFAGAVSADASGSCGDNLQWTFTDSNGELKITGSGAMYDYDTVENKTPWYDNRSSIKIVSLPDGLTTIGNYSFWQCSKFKKLVIPEGVTRIGDGAFYDCDTLKSGVEGDTITIPGSVKTLGNESFAECGSLKNVALQEGVATIGDKVFYNSYSLKSITLPSSLATIGQGAFSYTGSLKYVYLDSKNTNFSVNDGIIYGINANGKPERVISIIHEDESATSAYEIPTTVKSIDDYAFANSGMASVSIPSSVTKIGSYAFSGSSIRSVTIQKRDSGTTLTVGENAFSDLGNWEYHAIIYSPDSTITSLLAGTYKPGYTAVATHTNSNDIEYSFNTTGMWSNLGFNLVNQPYCSTMEPDLTYHWFNSSSGNEQQIVTQSGTVLKLKPLSIRYSWDSDVLTFTYDSTLGQSTKLIGDMVTNALYNRPLPVDWEDYSVVIKEGITDIEKEAFYQSWGYWYFLKEYNLKSVTLPTGLDSIGYHAFYFSNEENSVIYCPDEATANLFGPNTYNPDCTVIATHTSNPNEYEFNVSQLPGEDEKPGMLELSLENQPKNLPTYSGRVYSWYDENEELNCTIVNETGASNLRHLKLVPISYAWNANYDTVTFAYDPEIDGDSVISHELVYAALQDRTKKTGGEKGLKSPYDVSLDAQITGIGNEAFAHTGIQSIDMLNELSSLKTIGDSAFNDCDQLTKVNLIGDDVIIGDNVFQNSASLETIKITGIGALGEKYGRGLPSLTTIELSGKNIGVGNSEFTYKKNPSVLLESVKISGAAYVDQNALTKTNEVLTTLEISGTPEKKTEIVEKAFGAPKNYPPQLKSVKLSYVEAIATPLLQGSKQSIESLTLSNISRINESAFKDFTVLTSLTLSNIETIDNKTFMNCTLLPKVVIEGELNATKLGDQLFDGCSILTCFVSDVLQSEAAMEKFNSTSPIQVWYISTMDTSSIPEYLNNFSVAVLNGATLADDYEQSGLTLPTAVQMSNGNMIFKGWYTDPQFTGDIITELNETNTIAFAKWETPAKPTPTPAPHRESGQTVIQQQVPVQDVSKDPTPANQATADISAQYTSQIVVGTSTSDLATIKQLSAEAAAQIELSFSLAQEAGVPLTNSKGAKAIVVTDKSVPGVEKVTFSRVYEISPANEGEKLTKVTVKVPKSDITSKGLTSDDVTVYHFLESYNIWQPLEILSVSQDADNYYYTAATDGTSPFGVLVKKIESDTATPTTKPTQTQTQKSPAPFAGIVLGLGAALVLARLRK